jgi:hypothetical protein
VADRGLRDDAQARQLGVALRARQGEPDVGAAVLEIRGMRFAAGAIFTSSSTIKTRT